jgi:hypothetical protein
VKNYTVRRYNQDYFALWNAFASTAKNATFLFNRDFMEYHSNRFKDYSLMVFEDEKLVSILPANRVGDVVYSHQGLTYGGFVFDEKIKLGEVIAITKSVLAFLHQKEVLKLQLKLIPSIYNSFFSEEIEYCMFLTEAKLIRRDCLSVIDLTKEYKYSNDRKLCVNRGKKNNLQIKEETDFSSFWNEILIPNLKNRHQAQPVHSLEEITFLSQKFPENIRQFNVYHQGKIVAGTTTFVSKNVVHSQYISGNADRNKLASIDFLHDYLLKEVFSDKKYFDFGTSHEENGAKINQGLLYWKESFGAKTVCQHFYEVETSHYKNLETVFI